MQLKRNLYLLFCLPFWLVFLAVSPTVLAGEITLDNGDVIHGELSRITSDTVVWSSEIFGEVNIPKEKVKSFSSTTVLSTIETADHQNQNCTVQMTETVSGQCETGVLEPIALAQLISVQPVEVATKDDTVSGNAKLGYSRKSGNTNTEDLDFAVTTQWQANLFRHEAKLTAQSDKTNGQVVNERYDAGYQLNYDFDENWFSYGHVDYEKDRFGAIEEQYQLGGGLGHRTTFDNQLQTNAQLGATYLISKRPNGDSDKDLAGRWGLKLDWPVPDSNLVLFHHHELLWPLDDAENNQLESSTGLKIPLFGDLFGEFRYDFDYVNQPEGGQKHADDEWVISIGYQW